MNNDQIWQATLGELEINLSRVNFVTWFKDTFLSSFEDGRAIICVPNAFVKKWLEEKYHKNIVNSLENITKHKLHEIIYKIELRHGTANGGQIARTIKTPDNANTESKIETPETTIKTVAANRFGLNPKYVFENFVVGRGNELAHAACRAVVNNLGKAYNPLFIYGGVGLGKTHLLQAIGNEVAKHTDKILYATSEKFTNNYIQAVQTGKAKDFKNIYRNVDLLLVDDVQFMGGKDGTQEEFFHTFNELQQGDKQIVMTSDRPPKSIPAIEKRLISRFESGMVADVGKPDMETKIAILERKSIEKGFPLDKDVLIYIANNVQNNIRELEGALNKVVVIHQLSNSVPTLKSVRNALSDYVSSLQAKSLTAKEIIEAVSRFYEISLKEIAGNSRRKELVGPRQVAVYLIREELNSSYPSIGQEMGGRDHTTAMHAYNKILKEVKENDNEKLKQDLESIKQLYANPLY
ncbi:chromosomal replication initiator protein DnaA [Candidatus Falkowbacteria bacterium HGW-Falkowbacteria-2]|uniref:Chromosomal replication initiator protein DnaA n=1 Tax=Candidatus Falkowbacteria bacterium HGW-Falkowbacteria-2 TaxID=2013769 RepID=A0A2N2E3F7_9BACT|nr:MAG: chromosomal replication initiator protein DnaA [Candidatus Falkowbacteria bacterium HGW-Falkowbacteria-2]